MRPSHDFVCACQISEGSAQPLARYSRKCYDRSYSRCVYFLPGVPKLSPPRPYSLARPKCPAGRPKSGPPRAKVKPLNNIIGRVPVRSYSVPSSRLVIPVTAVTGHERTWGRYSPHASIGSLRLRGDLIRVTLIQIILRITLRVTLKWCAPELGVDRKGWYGDFSTITTYSGAYTMLKVKCCGMSRAPKMMS